MRRSSRAALLALAVLCGPARAQVTSAPSNRAYLLYRPEITYGSASRRSPADILVNRTFSIIQFEGQTRDVGDLKWDRGWLHVRDALLHPRAAVRRSGGTREWLLREFVPSGGRVWNWAWAPNYAEHVVGGGLSYRWSREWLQAHDVPLAGTLAAATIVIAGIGNEVIEGQGGPPGSAATLADIVFFEPLGILLFSNDAVVRFFGHTLEGADWSPQASITYPDGRLFNSSQLMSYKLPLPFVHDRLRVLFIIGETGLTGLQYRLPSGYHAGVALGFEMTKHIVDPVTRVESIEAGYGGALYIDRNNSLLLSAVRHPNQNGPLQLNLFPGVLPGKLRGLGLWFVNFHDGQWSAGLTFRQLLGLGIGMDMGR